MKKLKLESLEVTSFETASAAPAGRGTVQGNAGPSRPVATYFDCPTFGCPTDARLDCTYGCTLELEGPCMVSADTCTV